MHHNFGAFLDGLSGVWLILCGLYFSLGVFCPSIVVTAGKAEIQNDQNYGWALSSSFLYHSCLLAGASWLLYTVPNELHRRLTRRCSERRGSVYRIWLAFLPPSLSLGR